ncbi:MAG: ribonuclease, partial [Thermoplasmata archaeon]
IFGSIILPAGCRLVIARNAAGFRSLFGINPTVEGLTLSLGNSGDKVILRNPQGTDVDMVAWEGYVSGWTISAATGQSIVRSNALDTDTSADWSSATPSPEM